MKNIIKFALATAAALTLSSCNKWIDIPVEGTIPAETIDNTRQEGIQELVTGSYRRFLTQGIAEWEIVMVMGIRGDDLDKGTNPTDQADFNDFNAYNYANAGSFWAMGNTWNMMYAAISDFNEAIEALGEFGASGASEATIKDAIAQVTVLRDYYYFRLARIFGDIPVFFKNEDKSGIKKTQHDKVITRLIDDVKAVAEDLRDCKPNEHPLPGSVTKYTAYAVIAKFAAEILDYDTVLTYSDKVISKYGNALYPDYHYLFTSQANICDENLLEAQRPARLAEANPWTGFTDFQGPGATITTKDGASMGGGWSFFCPTDKIVNLMKSRGETVRYETDIINGGEETWYGDYVDNNVFSNRWNGKVYNPSGLCYELNWGNDINVRVIRYADILLLNAEARVQKGQNGDQYYNWVRSRANMPEKTGVTFEDIMEERFVELCFENGERFYDLVRTGLAAKELASEGYDDSKKYFPLPQTVLDATATMNEPAE